MHVNQDFGPRLSSLVRQHKGARHGIESPIDHEDVSSISFAGSGASLESEVEV